MRGMCSAMLFLEAIVLGLATPVMVSVEDVDTAAALGFGLGLAAFALLTAGLLGRPWGYSVGHLVQVGAIALGLLVPVMFFIGAMFAALWITAFLLGRRIEADKAARSA
ncbi:MAG: DUF4233 domain-containing protein [Nocardioidaceae bacterium]